MQNKLICNALLDLNAPCKFINTSQVCILATAETDTFLVYLRHEFPATPPDCINFSADGTKLSWDPLFMSGCHVFGKDLL
jgi:hypothetical protein